MHFKWPVYGSWPKLSRMFWPLGWNQVHLTNIVLNQFINVFQFHHHGIPGISGAGYSSPTLHRWCITFIKQTVADVTHLQTPLPRLGVAFPSRLMNILYQNEWLHQWARFHEWKIHVMKWMISTGIIFIAFYGSFWSRSSRQLMGSCRTVY